MPPPPRRREPSAPQGESKTGLVIALVFFILTTLISATMAYLFYNDGQKALADKKSAEDATKKANDERSDAVLARSLAHIYIGSTDPTNRTNFDNTKGRDATKLTAELSALNALVAAHGIRWEPNNDNPTVTLVAQLNQYRTDAKAAADRAATAEANAANALITTTQNNDQNDAAKAAAQAAQTRALAGENAAKAAKAKEFLDTTDLVKTLREQLAEANTKSADDQATVMKRVKSLEKTVSDKDILIQKLQAQLDLKRDDILATDKPRGTISRVDNRAGLAYIDIGRAQGARSQLTFSVLAPNAVGKGAGKRERKGAVEIVRVLGDRLSEARIIDVTNALQDPILAGDLLFNPAWDPSQREHVAIAGLVDINGDGIDDTPELVRSLEKQGTIVDAWLDIRDVQIKGSGMTGTTSWLILGEIPQSDTGGLQAAGEREKKKGEIRLQIQKMKDDAKVVGVQTIQARAFLRLTGLAMPNTAAPADFVPAGTIKPGDAAKPADKKPDDKKDDEEKK